MRKYLQFLLIIAITTISYSQEKVTLSGNVSDAKNNETLIGVSVVIPMLKIGTFTNEYGFYSLTIPKGTYEIDISSIGYETQTIIINLNENTKQNISLSEST